MLLIAQPKTASTSLMTALGKITSLGYKQNLKLPYKKHPGWQKLTHSDMRIIPDNILYFWATDNSYIYKQHLLPIEKHKKNLLASGARFVVLFREPTETLESYGRLSENYKIKKELKKYRKEILNEIVLWHKNALSLFSGPQFLQIWFEDVINDTTDTINRILKFYGFDIEIGSDYILPKKRYKR